MFSSAASCPNGNDVIQGRLSQRQKTFENSGCGFSMIASKREAIRLFLRIEHKGIRAPK